MALKSVTQFPLFAPPPPPHRPPTEIRLSRWNNANAEKFIRRERTQKELEDQLRLQKRFDSALSIAHNYNPAHPHRTTFKSTGTPSSPSSPSIPGKRSKYSTSTKSRPHPAFERLSKPRQLPTKKNETLGSVGPNYRIDDNGVSYEMPDAPFLYQYSYTETPKLKPVKLREPLVSPFGPESMAKPWMGRKPLPPSKKKLPEFDSFRLPLQNKKGMKPVQAPGPFLPGSGPKYVMSREEILGEPLTKDEIDLLIQGSKKSERQLNIGRDGLTHNMLDNIHAHWKRRRVCKIKCKGVCTVDMNNVCQQLEEKTGGKIIYNRGGVIYLFRGRNYNYKSRPRFPLMLWKPISPVYPRLIQRVPETLTLEQATEMRETGKNLPPICKLAKNGVYCNLVENVREAFEACELVRINCQGLNASDYRKIGAKLKDLVPCVLLSFEYEHILIWRGQDWTSSLTEAKESAQELKEVKVDDIVVGHLPCSLSVPIMEANAYVPYTASSTDENEEALGNNKFIASEEVTEVISSTNQSGEALGDNELFEVAAVEKVSEVPILHSGLVLTDESIKESGSPAGLEYSGNILEASNPSIERLEDNDCITLELTSAVPKAHDHLDASSTDNMSIPITASLEGVLLLKEQAVKDGIATLLENHSFDADTVFQQAVAFAKDARPAPVFRRRPKRVSDEVEQERNHSELKQPPAVSPTEITNTERRGERKSRRNENMEDIKADYLNAAPQGSLRLDELAKLLA